MVRQEVNNFGSSVVVQALVLQSYVHFYNDILDFWAENYFLIDSHKKTFFKAACPSILYSKLWRTTQRRTMLHVIFRKKR